MSEEFKYLSFESQNSEIKDLINSGNIYKMRQGLSGLLLPAGIDDGLLENERDRKYLKELYPQRISEINGYIEDECDKLEYEGSPMFAEYPDREVVRGIARDIYNKLDVDDDDWAYSDGEMSQSESVADSRQMFLSIWRPILIMIWRHLPHGTMAEIRGIRVVIQDIRSTMIPVCKKTQRLC